MNSEVTSALRNAGIELSSEQVQQLAIICYRTEQRMLVQFAAYGKVTAPEENVRLVDVVVPPEVAQVTRAQFLAAIRTVLGTDLDWDDRVIKPAIDRLARRLRYFGERPWTFSFEGENATLATAASVEWRESYDGKADEGLVNAIYGGTIEKPGFQKLYGPLADRVLFDR